MNKNTKVLALKYRPQTFDDLIGQNVVAETKYGINFPSIVNKENVYGCQFHPEKSSAQGLNIIRSFINL